jgi:D-amino-acid dehydrogenase
MHHQTETLVIGGGAIGICCAYYLNELGKNVTVVEKDDICAGSSYGNAGLIVPSYSIPLAAPGVIAQGLKWMFNPRSPFYIKPRFQKGFLSWIWKFYISCNQHHINISIPVLRDLSFASLELFDELAVIEGVDFGLEKKGVIELFNTHRRFEHGTEDSRLMQRHGLENRIIKKDELQQFIGDIQTTAVGGIFSPDDAQLVPDRFVHQLARFIEKKGVHLLNSVEVLGFEISGRKVTTVKTTRGEIFVGEVILAGGCWSGDLARELKIRLMIEPAKGYSVTFKRPAACPAIPIAMSEAEVVLTPMQDMIRFAGTFELAGFDLSINARRLKAILKAIPAYLPDIDPDALELIEIWRGLRPCSPDGLPYLGRPRQYDNVIIAAGHGMLGISLAPITGKIVSQLASDQAQAMDISALRIERFN